MIFFIARLRPSAPASGKRETRTIARRKALRKSLPWAAKSPATSQLGDSPIFLEQFTDQTGNRGISSTDDIFFDSTFKRVLSMTFSRSPSTPKICGCNFRVVVGGRLPPLPRFGSAPIRGFTAPFGLFDDVAIGSGGATTILLTSSLLFLSFCSVTPMPFTGNRNRALGFLAESLETRRFGSRRLPEAEVTKAALRHPGFAAARSAPSCFRRRRTELRCADPRVKCAAADQSGEDIRQGTKRADGDFLIFRFAEFLNTRMRHD